MVCAITRILRYTLHSSDLPAQTQLGIFFNGVSVLQESALWRLGSNPEKLPGLPPTRMTFIATGAMERRALAASPDRVHRL